MAKKKSEPTENKQNEVVEAVQSQDEAVKKASGKRQKACAPESEDAHEDDGLVHDEVEREITSSIDDADYDESEAYEDDEDALPEDGEALFDEIEKEMADEWRRDFMSMETEEQQITLYNIMVERLLWHIVYYLRRFPERLGSSKGVYTDRCVGMEEVRSLMGKIDRDGFASKWLEMNAIPEIDQIMERLTILNAQIDTMMGCENKTPIANLQRNFGLTDIELTVLATLVIAMNEEALMRLMCVAWADFTVRLPTVSFIANLLGDTPELFEAVKAALCSQGRLRRMKLVTCEMNASFGGRAPQVFTPLSVDQEVIDAFCGYPWTKELPPNMTVYTKGLPENKLICDEETIEELKYALNRPSARVCLVGPTHSGRRTLLSSIIIPLEHRPIMELNVPREFESVPEYELADHMANIMRRTLLLGGILMMRFDGIDKCPEVLHKLTNHSAELNYIGRNYPGAIVMLARNYYKILEDEFNNIIINIPKLSVERAENIWHDALVNYTDPDLARRMSIAFSRNYTLPIGSIFQIVARSVDAQLTKGYENVRLQSHHILEEIQKSFDHELGSLAEISVSSVPISGVVLTDESKAQIKEILAYAKNLYTVLHIWGFNRRSPYGNALSMLFVGPPGTGKTLMANAIANELGKVLYRVDLSRIVDKYIGETEKNLGRIFDEAAKAQAIILFDEADALFSKRTDVKSSNDRHANQEINFLLQKLESYNGITILTTNLSKSIDDAFRRRIRFIVEFPMPDARARASLWKRMIPPEAPIEKHIRWSWLAETFEMTGGHIRNAVLKASIAAASENAPLGMPHLAKAALEEAHSMGVLIRVDENDYADYEGEFDDDDDVYKW